MRLIAALGITAVLVTGTMRAQAPAATSTGAITGLMHAIHATDSVDKTLAFYTQVFGLMGQVQAFTNPNVPLLTDSPGVTLRLSMLRLPSDEQRGMGFELTEFSNVQRHPAQPKMWDPGAPHMIFLVRDLAPVMAAIKATNAPIVTKSGAPVKVTSSLGASTAIVVRDPDGYLVHIFQVTPPAGAPAGNLIGSIPAETVNDMATSQKFWKDIMGLAATGDAGFKKDKAMLDVLGLPDGAEYRTASGLIPGSKVRMEFFEIKGAGAKTPFSLRVPDPGSSGFAINVADIENLLPKLKAKGVRVISKDQALVPWD
ncbi:MAG TPA: VOC family protein, partial [Tepidisphaeraceae bacterium]|nr:VOC family protein [Tepidisphaeraceae bacterium]